MAAIAYFFGTKTANSEPPWDSSEPIRAELFNNERFEQHAKSLAAAQRISTSRFLVRRQRITHRLDDNYAALLSAYETICESVGSGRPITPAAEWLIDNFHIVEDQIRQVQQDLPAGYYKELPKLAEGPLAGYPRVLGIAWAFVAHTDSLFDPEMLARFVLAYQKVEPLGIGELWAVAITLRIVLIENLRRLADRISKARMARESANELADALLALEAVSTQTVYDLLRKHEADAFSKTFAVQLDQRLRDQGDAAAVALQWLERQLAAQGSSADQAISEEHQRQTAANATVRNIFTSMRLISDVDWSDWFERASLVHEALARYPIYTRMDFATRNNYRNAIEELARGSGVSELEVTKHVIEATDERTEIAEPGYFLIGRGRAEIEARIRFRPKATECVRRGFFRSGVKGYLVAITVITLLLLLLILLVIIDRTNGTIAIGLALLGVVPSSEVAIALVNHAVTRLMGARLLPALEFRDGIPQECRTMVVVPTLLTSRETLKDEIERLEVHFLTEPQGEVFFALLTDWADSLSEEEPADKDLLEVALQGIAELNKRHGASESSPRFLLLHRNRIWNASEGRWMGWERKRGKLHELNLLLRGTENTSFSVISGRLPDTVRYVVTLDADTRMLRHTVRRLVGKMAHPLNRPVFDEQSQRVVQGYGILQPRVTPSLPDTGERSVYQRLFSTPQGIDPYVLAVSDVYQDLFGQGSFTGKGIYDIDAFEDALRDRIPENALLSHDAMNRVGHLGKGESVWLGWFTHATLSAFIPLAQARGKNRLVTRWQQYLTQLRTCLETSAWDGAWYLRGYFDDGSPLGSSTSEECRIDALAQSWAVISEAADLDRQRRAMAEVEKQLIQWEDRIAPLFTPPFNKTHLDPGYIKGYPPGIRENGGQYTHASCWTVFAFAKLRQTEKALPLFAMLNPISHSATRIRVERYRTEPYVVAADVYSGQPHAGRGGWTWYTGSAGWLYQAALQAILGLERNGDQLMVNPCIPEDWNGFEVILKSGSARYELHILRKPTKETRQFSDDVLRPQSIHLIDDSKTHRLTLFTDDEPSDAELVRPFSE